MVLKHIDVGYNKEFKHRIAFKTFMTLDIMDMVG